MNVLKQSDRNVIECFIQKTSQSKLLDIPNSALKKKN